jgi:hypothetical protein
LFREHLSPVDESACNPKPKSLRQAERNSFHVEQNELANYSSHGGYEKQLKIICAVQTRWAMKHVNGVK